MEKLVKNKLVKDIIGFGKKMNVVMNIMFVFLVFICIFLFLYIIVIFFFSELFLVVNGF